jgi:ornithine cyclodeaminase/alanine dehydrogenase-like protein (mu-crystallin family)
MTTIPHLSSQDLDALSITTHDVIDIIEKMIKGASDGTVFSAPKSVIQTPDGRYIMSTLAASNDPPIVATKSLVLNERNSDIGLPQINAIVTVLNGETGIPFATVDGNWITAVRTAGLSAVAAKYLASPSSKSVGFVGTGVQARSHLKAFSEMFPLERIKIFGRGQANIDLLSDLATDLGLTAECVSSPKEAISNVDIVVTSVTHTGVKGPFLDANWLSAGSFAAIADLGVPWRKESFSQLDRVIIDDLNQEAQMPVKLAKPTDVTGDLEYLISSSQNSNVDTRTAFVFRGHALGDLALTALAYQRYFKESDAKAK